MPSEPSAKAFETVKLQPFLPQKAPGHSAECFLCLLVTLTDSDLLFALQQNTAHACKQAGKRHAGNSCRGSRQGLQCLHLFFADGNASCLVRAAVRERYGNVAVFIDRHGRNADTVFSVAAVSSENAAQVAVAEGWTVLEQKGEIVYVCRLESGAAAQAVSLDTVRTMFRLIRTSWRTGETH